MKIRDFQCPETPLDFLGIGTVLGQCMKSKAFQHPENQKFSWVLKKALKKEAGILSLRPAYLSRIQDSPETILRQS